MQSQLTTIVEQFQEVQARLHRLADALPADRWAARPDPERWSVAECVAHLNLTSEAYLPIIRDGLQRARALGGPAPRQYRRDLVGWLLARMTGPIPAIGGVRLGKTKTAPAFVPRGEQPREALLADFDRLQAEQIALTREAEGLPLDRVKIVSPFDARVQYNLYSALTILPGHQKRHLLQAQEVWPRTSP